MNKNITIFAYTVAIFGIVAELASFIPSPFEDPYTFSLIRGFMRCYWVGLFDLTGFEVGTGQYMNIMNLVASVFLLIGTMQFSKTNGNETRLIRYLLGVLLFSSILDIIDTGVYPELIMYKGPSGLKSALVAVGSWVFLNEIGKTKRIVASGDGDSPKLIRLANWAIDVTTVMLTASPYAMSDKIALWLDMQMGREWATTLFLMTARFVYYLFFEISFRATPGKFVTGTKVISADDTDATIGEIIGRTLARFIPFDGLSFLWRLGWHDSLSYTKVVNEESIVESSIVAYPDVIDQIE